MKNTKFLSLHHLLAFFLPGLYLLLNIGIVKYFPENNNFTEFTNMINQNIKLPFASLLFIFSIFIGIIIDALRNTACERLYDCFRKYNMTEAWKMFSLFDKDKKEMFYDSYYSYYSFDTNIIISSIVALLFYFYTCFIDTTLNPFSWFTILNTLIILVLIFDASSLRIEMKEFCLNSI